MEPKHVEGLVDQVGHIVFVRLAIEHVGVEDDKSCQDLLPRGTVILTKAWDCVALIVTNSSSTSTAG
jgi:hypothetical protein